MAPQKQLPKPPKNLSAASKKRWNTLVSEYEFEERHLDLLRGALEQLDLADGARRMITEDGPVVSDRWGQPKEHPGVGIERNARLTAMRLMRELGLDIAPPAESRGPRRPGTRS